MQSIYQEPFLESKFASKRFEVQKFFVLKKKKLKTFRIQALKDHSKERDNSTQKRTQKGDELSVLKQIINKAYQDKFELREKMVMVENEIQDLQQKINSLKFKEIKSGLKAQESQEVEEYRENIIKIIKDRRKHQLKI